MLKLGFILFCFIIPACSTLPKSSKTLDEASEIIAKNMSIEQIEQRYGRHAEKAETDEFLVFTFNIENKFRRLIVSYNKKNGDIEAINLSPLESERNPEYLLNKYSHIKFKKEHQLWFSHYQDGYHRYESDKVRIDCNSSCTEVETISFYR